MRYVSPTARVSGNAQVCDNAQVRGNAQVFDNARVSGRAWASGRAQVLGHAQVTGHAWVSDHMVVDRPDGYITLGPIGSEHRTATAAWDYKLRAICVRAGCWYGPLEELEARITPNGDHPWGKGDDADRYRVQYECLIATASYIPEPNVWPEVQS